MRLIYACQAIGVLSILMANAMFYACLAELNRFSPTTEQISPFWIYPNLGRFYARHKQAFPRSIKRVTCLLFIVLAVVSTAFALIVLPMARWIVYGEH